MIISGLRIARIISSFSHHFPFLTHCRAQDGSLYTEITLIINGFDALYILIHNRNEL